MNACPLTFALTKDMFPNFICDSSPSMLLMKNHVIKLVDLCAPMNKYGLSSILPRTEIGDIDNPAAGNYNFKTPF